MIILTKEQILIIQNYAKNDYPRETCGILAGYISKNFSWCNQNSDEKTKITEKIYKMVNISEHPETCYFVKTEEQLKVFKEIRKLNLEMIGIYHSHAHVSAYPSQRDCELAFYPEVSYVIISLQTFNKPDIRSFRIIENKIEEEKLIVGEIKNEF